MGSCSKITNYAYICRFFGWRRKCNGSIEKLKKRKDTKKMIKILKILLKTSEDKLSIRDKKKILENLLKIQSANYSTRRKKSREELSKILELTP